MASHSRLIDIHIKQSFDESSATRTSEQVKASAKKNAAAITAAEEAESRKRVAFIEKEAAAKQQALDAAKPTPTQTGATVAQEDSSGLSDKGAARLTAALHKLQELMGDYQEQAQACVSATDDIRLAMEEAANAAGAGEEVFTDANAGLKNLVERQAELHMSMQEVSQAAGQLAEQFSRGAISNDQAREAATALQERNKAVAAGLKELRQDAQRLQQDMQASIPLIEQEGEARRTAAENARQANSKLRTMSDAVTGSIIKGFKAAGRAVETFRNVVGKVTFAMAVINQAWDGLSKLWDFLQSKSEAATKAAEEHAEALQELREEADRVYEEQLSASRKVKAERVYEYLEDGIRRTNRELARGLELRKRDLDMQAKQKELELDRKEWALEAEADQIEHALATGDMSADDAARRKEDIERRRAENAYQRDVERRQSELAALQHEQTRLEAGIASAQKDLQRLETLRSELGRFLSPSQAKDKLARYQKGAMRRDERIEYQRHREQSKTLMDSLGMGDMHEAYLWGDFDLPARLAETDKKIREHLNKYEERLADVDYSLEILNHEQQGDAERHGAKLSSLRRKAATAEVTRRQKQDEKLADEASEHADDAAGIAQQRSRTMLRENERLIGNRTGEDELVKLYREVKEAGDADTLRRIISELNRNGQQVRWSERDFTNYGQEPLTRMATLKGESRLFWADRFQTLQKSQKMEGVGKKLEAAADRLDAADSSEDVASILRGVHRLVEVCKRQTEESSQQRQEINALSGKISVLEAQLRNNKR